MDDAALHACVERLLRRYHARFPDEAARHPVLCTQLDAGEDVLVRANMTGHVTSSAAVLDRAGSAILLVHHRIFDKWLPPGGHYEPPGSLWDSALREVAEETGVREVVAHPWTVAHGGLPIDVDTHAIPANPAKGEGPHVHHDFRFLAVADGGQPLVPQRDEVHDARWMPLATLRESPDDRVRALHAKLARLGLIGS